MSKKKLTLANNPLLSGPALGERYRIGVPYREIDLSAIDRDPNQPRVHFDEERLQELSESIRTYGVLSPLLVKPGKSQGRFTLIAGERRFRAAKLAGLEKVPALIDSESDENGERTLALQLVENLQRSDLTPLERAHAIAALRDAHSLSVREVAERLGVSKSMVQRSLELLNLPDDLLNALREGASESKILLLSKIEDKDIRASYLQDLDSLTRTKLEKEVSQHDSERAGAGRKVNISPEDERVRDEIQRALGLKVSLNRSASDSESGKLVIEFYSDEDLQELFRKLATHEGQ